MSHEPLCHEPDDWAALSCPVNMTQYKTFSRATDQGSESQERTWVVVERSKCPQKHAEVDRQPFTTCEPDVLLEELHCNVLSIYLPKNTEAERLLKSRPYPGDN